MPFRYINVDRGASSPALADLKAAVEAHASAIVRDPLSDWRHPIKFRGAVVDQDSNPISGANVALSWNDLSPGGTTGRIIASDDRGEFELMGVSGKALSVEVSKVGYFQVGKSIQSFEIADPASPNYLDTVREPIVEFRLIRATENPRVLKYCLDTTLDSKHGVTFDPVRLRFDTTQALMFELRRGYFNTWSLVVRSSSTGVLEADDEVLFVPPLEGYVNEFVAADKIDFDASKYALKTKFYFKSGSRPYFGAAEVEVVVRSKIAGGDDFDANIAISFSVNSDGDRDLSSNPIVSGIRLNAEEIRNGFGPVGLERN
ncbi:MAG: carboxypeptidase regulatory-like domain-containing protein [Verrucomicrobiales bacterium]|nr:carboxypeptidase regulatory-like domain-containing protein [Verrucomicrobiales bacterium]